MSLIRRTLKPPVAWWFRSGHRVQLTKDLDPLLRRLEGLVLDVGGGRSAPHDASYTAKVRRLRVDMSARESPEVLADAAVLPFRSVSVDGVTLCEILVHVPEPRAVIDEARRVLRSGGVLCGSVPFVMSVHPDPGDFYRYTASGLEHLLSDYSSVQIRAHGNFLGSVWKLLRLRFPVLVALNPIGRKLSATRDERCPEGYVFVAIKGSEASVA